jgi:hypothetical protein
LADLGVDYVFIKNNQTFRFSANRVSQLANREYFTPVYQNSVGTLYSVSEAFKNTKDSEMTLKKMAEMIPDNKIVYLDMDRLPMHDVRKGFLVELSDRTKLIGPKPVICYDYFMYIAANLPIKATDVPDAGVQVPELGAIDYAIMSDENDPNDKLSGKFVKIAEIPFTALWKNTLKR